MERRVRLIAFLLISLTLHLLIFWSGMTSPGPASRAAQHGVGLVARSTEQFLWRPAAARPEPKPEAKTAVTQPETTKPLPKPQRKRDPKPNSPVETVKVDSAVGVQKKVEKTVPEREEVPHPEQQSNRRTAAELSPPAVPAERLDTREIGQDSFLSGPAQPEGLNRADATAAATGFQQALPRYKLNPLPYPESARRRGQEGTVRLEVLVKIDGRVGDVRLENSSGHRVLDRAALQAVRRWRFKPATRYGQVVESRVVIPVDFVLHSGD